MSTQEHLPTLSISVSAINRISELMIEEENPNLKLRVYITGGGCAGFQYGFMFDETARADDIYIEAANDEAQGKKVTIAVDPLSLTYLDGANIDFVENIRGAHFKITNPNAQTTCSCGSSFSIGLDD